jgi:hypothetical protein
MIRYISTAPGTRRCASGRPSPTSSRTKIPAGGASLTPRVGTARKRRSVAIGNRPKPTSARGATSSGKASAIPSSRRRAKRRFRRATRRTEAVGKKTSRRFVRLRRSPILREERLERRARRQAAQGLGVIWHRRQLGPREGRRPTRLGKRETHRGLSGSPPNGATAKGLRGHLPASLGASSLMKPLFKAPHSVESLSSKSSAERFVVRSYLATFKTAPSSVPQ